MGQAKSAFGCFEPYTKKGKERIEKEERLQNQILVQGWEKENGKDLILLESKNRQLQEYTKKTLDRYKEKGIVPTAGDRDLYDLTVKGTQDEITQLKARVQQRYVLINKRKGIMGLIDTTAYNRQEQQSIKKLVKIGKIDTKIEKNSEVLEAIQAAQDQSQEVLEDELELTNTFNKDEQAKSKLIAKHNKNGGPKEAHAFDHLMVPNGADVGMKYKFVVPTPTAPPNQEKMETKTNLMKLEQKNNHKSVVTV